MSKTINIGSGSKSVTSQKSPSQARGGKKPCNCGRK